VTGCRYGATNEPTFRNSPRGYAGGIKFVIERYLRFAGQAGEQWTMFLVRCLPR
jgi:extradiol dioxygenase family protein